MSNDLTEAVSQVAATVVGDTAREGLEIKSSEVLETNPNLVGSTAKGLEVVVLRGCFGEPKRSSLLALGCSNCGCSAKGIGSEVPKGSGGGQPKHNVDSDLWKKICRRPLLSLSCSSFSSTAAISAAT